MSDNCFLITACKKRSSDFLFSGAVVGREKGGGGRKKMERKGSVKMKKENK